MKDWGFIGPSSPALTTSQDCQRSVNLYLEMATSGRSKSRASLVSAPGYIERCTLPGGIGRGLWSMDGLVLGVGGSGLYRINADWSVTPLHALAVGVEPVTIHSNGAGTHQIFIVSGGRGHIYDTLTGALTNVTAADHGAFLSGAFLALDRASNTVYASNPFLGLTWNPLSKGQRSAAPDAVQAITAADDKLWWVGSETGEIWYPTGTGLFPFQLYPGAVFEPGTIARDSVAVLNKAPIWLGAGKDVKGVVYAASGFTAQRISNDAVEAAIDEYATLSDAVGWTYGIRGHLFYQLNFPTANATWVYDGATGAWHERLWWDTATAQWQCSRAQFHCLAWGKHLVCDRLTGKVYEMSEKAYTDIAGAPLRRLRRTPYICDEMRRLKHRLVRLDIDVGVGNEVDPGKVPQAMLQFSDDQCHTWSDEDWADLGEKGQYGRIVEWPRLGESISRSYQLVITDPVPVRIADAYADIRPARAGGGL